MVSQSTMWNDAGEGILLIGIASEVITPPLGSRMSGFDARTGVAESVHDELHARALAIECDGVKTLLVSLDLLGMDEAFGKRVRAEIEKKTGIPAAHIILGATHTHCGPAIFVPFYNPAQEIDQEYLTFLAETIVAAADRASTLKRPRRIRSGLVEVEGVGVNRRTPDGRPIDPFAGVVLVEEPDGTPVAVTVFYACHTTVLGPNTLAFTADYPYFTELEIRAAMGDQVEFLFFNGTEGDISVGHKSDLSAVGIIAPFRTFEKAEEIGRRLGRAVLAGLSNLPQEAAAIAVERRVLPLPLKQYEPAAKMDIDRKATIEHVRELEAKGAGEDELIRARQQRLFARIEAHYADLWEAIPQMSRPKTIDAEVIAVAIGGTCLLSYPGEVFVEIGLQVRAMSPFARTYFIGLANNYLGYFPTATANAALGYEVVAARVTPEAAEDLTRGSVATLQAAFDRINAGGSAARG